MTASPASGAGSPEDPLEIVGDLIEHVVDALDLDAEVDVSDDGETILGVVDGEEVGLLIGRHGQTIDAVQHLAYKAIAKQELGRRVVIDAAGYRGRREQALHRQADEAVAVALRDGRPVALEPMGAVERKVVHEHLKSRPDVETHSEGDEPNRRLVVSPAGP